MTPARRPMAFAMLVLACAEAPLPAGMGVSGNPTSPSSPSAPPAPESSESTRNPQPAPVGATASSGEIEPAPAAAPTLTAEPVASSGGRPMDSATGQGGSSGGEGSTAGTSPIAGASSSLGATGGVAEVPFAGSGGVDGPGGAPGGSGAGGNQAPSEDPESWFGPPSCEDYIVCESFETTAEGALPPGWELVGYGERTVAVSAEAARGERGLRIDIPPQAAVVGMLEIPAPEQLSGAHWGRLFVRLEELPSQFIHYDLFAGIGPWMNYQHEVRWAVTGTSVGEQPGNHSFIYNVQPIGEGAPGEFGSEGDRSVHPVVGEWMCLEWHFDVDAQEARFFYGGQEVDYLHIDDERSEIPPFDVLRVGFQKFQQTDALLVFVDEVTFHDERISCAD